jgi:glutamine amidotransferase
MKVSVIDYNMGNVESVTKALSLINIDSVITSDKKEISASDVIVLPGVGSFKAGMEHLNNLDLIDLLREEVLVKRKPFLGICLGMQLLATTGNEPEQCEGLGWVDGEVMKINSNDLRVPHMGWNDIRITNSQYISKDLKSKDFYFTHSFHFVPENKNVISSVTDYGDELVSSIEQDNIFATQFHPEKSQDSGIALMATFFEKHA